MPATPSLIVPDIPTDVAAVPYRAILDTYSGDEIGLCFGPEDTMPELGWAYGPESTMPRSTFDAAVWPLMPDLEREAFAAGQCAKVFR